MNSISAYLDLETIELIKYDQTVEIRLTLVDGSRDGSFSPRSIVVHNIDGQIRMPVRQDFFFDCFSLEHLFVSGCRSSGQQVVRLAVAALLEPVHLPLLVYGVLGVVQATESVGVWRISLPNKKRVNIQRTVVLHRFGYLYLCLHDVRTITTGAGIPVSVNNGVELPNKFTGIVKDGLLFIFRNEDVQILKQQENKKPFDAEIVSTFEGKMLTSTVPLAKRLVAG